MRLQLSLFSEAAKAQLRSKKNNVTLGLFRHASISIN